MLSLYAWVRAWRGVMRVFGTMSLCIAGGLAALVIGHHTAHACVSSAISRIDDGCPSLVSRPSTAQIVDQWASEVVVSPADGLPLLMQGEVAGPPPAVIPFQVAPSETGVSMRASTRGLQDYQSQKINRRIDDSKRLAPKDLPSPKAPVRAASPLDIWTNVDLQAAAASDTDRTQRASAGADYTVTKTAKVGVAAERSQTHTIAGTAQIGDEKVSAYVAVQAFPALSFDAIGQWHAGDNVAPETGEAGKTEKTSVTLAPRVAKSFTLGSGDTISPFITYKREIDVGKSGSGAVDALDTAGAGVTFAKPDDYSLSLTTDVEGIGSTEPANVNSKVQLKLPFK